jgi:hypothetical protein
MYGARLIGSQSDEHFLGSVVLNIIIDNMVEVVNADTGDDFI